VVVVRRVALGYSLGITTIAMGIGYALGGAGAAILAVIAASIGSPVIVVVTPRLYRRWMPLSKPPGKVPADRGRMTLHGCHTSTTGKRTARFRPHDLAHFARLMWCGAGDSIRPRRGAWPSTLMTPPARRLGHRLRPARPQPRGRREGFQNSGLVRQAPVSLVQGFTRARGYQIAPGPATARIV